MHAEMKSGLNAILPASLSEQLAMRVADVHYTYQGFRDFVVNQTQIILMNRKRLPIHAVADDDRRDAAGGQDDDNDHNDDVQDLELANQVLAIIRGRPVGGHGAGRFRKRTPSATRNSAQTATNPTRDAKCSNCHGNHTKAECKKPPVDMADRTCFTCGEKNRSSGTAPSGPAAHAPGAR